MTDRPAKQAYTKIRRIIHYNTLNDVQGPGVSKTSVKQIATRSMEPRQFEKSLTVLKRNLDVFEYNGKLTLVDEPHLIAIQEYEASKDSPNKRLIGHINQIRGEL